MPPLPPAAVLILSPPAITGSPGPRTANRPPPPRAPETHPVPPSRPHVLTARDPRAGPLCFGPSGPLCAGLSFPPPRGSGRRPVAAPTARHARADRDQILTHEQLPEAAAETHAV